MRGARLTGGGDIVQLALDGEKRCLIDGSRIDTCALEAERTFAKPGFLKDGPGVLEKKPAIQIHDRGEKIEERKPARIGAVVEKDLGPKLSAFADASRKVDPKRDQVEMSGIDAPASARICLEGPV